MLTWSQGWGRWTVFPESDTDSNDFSTYPFPNPEFFPKWEVNVNMELGKG